MSTIIKNPSPKARFVSSPTLVKSHRDLLADNQLQMSMDFALLQYQATLTNNMPSDMAGAAAVGLRLLGAQEFVSTFRLLAETANLPAPAKNNGNLDHSA